MLSELELKAYSLEWGNPSFATHAKNGAGKGQGGPAAHQLHEAT